MEKSDKIVVTIIIRVPLPQQHILAKSTAVSFLEKVAFRNPMILCSTGWGRPCILISLYI